MPNSSVYVETTVVSYFASRESSDAIVAGHQAVTRAFWADAPTRFNLMASELVVRECAAGDQNAAEARLKLLVGLPRLASSESAEQLTVALMKAGAIPVTEPRDAAHIAIAATNGIEFLVTWNFRHIGNATRRSDIERVCRMAGFEPPLICSPDELLGRPEDVV